MYSNAPETVYFYIANVNPDGAIDLLTGKYGYSLTGNNISTDDIASGLSDIIQSDGQSALIDVYNLHPDKQMILELYGSPASCGSQSPCSPAPAPPQMPSVSSSCGNQSCGKSWLSSPTNVMILAVGVIAVISLVKKS